MIALVWGLSKEGLGGQICPICVCIAQELWVFFLTVYMLSKVQKEKNIPEQIKVV